MGLQPLNEEALKKRTELLAEHDYQNRMFDLARQFANADKIVIAAPHWDLSFPAILKIYIENVYVTGIVSKYDEHGRPQGMCRAEKLYYVTTSGGPLIEDYGYGYIKNLMTDFWGIKETALVKAEMLDVMGFDPEKIITDTINSLIV